MDFSTGLGLVAVLVLVLANGFFVATEFAIVGVRRSRLEQLAAAGDANAAAAKHVVGHLDTYIAACQLGITMASLALGWLGEPAFAHLVEPPLEALVGQFAPTAAHGVAVGVSFAIITALHIVIGELAPKGLALQAPEGTTLWVTRPMMLFEYAFRWPIRLLNGVGNGVLKLFGLHPAAGHEMVHSVEELRVLVHAARQAGGVEESEARIATKAFSFADLTAGALMTPRTEVEAVPVEAGAAQLAARFGVPGDGGRRHHQRVPVYEGSLDHVLGVLHLTDFWQTVAATAPHERDALPLRPLLRPTMVVPETKPADATLEEMRTTGHYFAVVIDEYGGTAGVLTLDDLVEALIGPMAAEQHPGVGPVDALATGDGESSGPLVFDGLTRLQEWEDVTGLHLTEEDHAAVETLGGLVMTRLGRIPEAGDEIAVAERTLRVEEMDGLRVARVQLVPSGGAGGAGGSGDSGPTAVRGGGGN